MSFVPFRDMDGDKNVTVYLPADVANNPLVHHAIEIARAQASARLAQETANRALALADETSAHVQALHNLHTNKNHEVNWLLYLTRTKDMTIPDVRGIHAKIGADIRRFSIRLGYEPDPKRSDWLNNKPFHVYPTWILDRWFEERGGNFS